MTVIQVLHTSFDLRLDEDVWANYISKLPPKIHSDVERYVRWQDRQSVLLGKMLLLKGLRQHMGQGATLEEFSYAPHGRPFLIRRNRIDFNISHSGGHVVCAITPTGRVGIDIEKIRSLNLMDFKAFLRATEWDDIWKAKEPFDMFFSCWTKMESVIKADGRGLSVPLYSLYIEGDTAILDGHVWFLKEIEISPIVKCCLASSLNRPEIVIQKFDKHCL